MRRENTSERAVHSLCSNEDWNTTETSTLQSTLISKEYLPLPVNSERTGEKTQLPLAKNNTFCWLCYNNLFSPFCHPWDANNLSIYWGSLHSLNQITIFSSNQGWDKPLFNGEKAKHRSKPSCDAESFLLPPLTEAAQNVLCHAIPLVQNPHFSKTKHMPRLI